MATEQITNILYFGKSKLTKERIRNEYDLSNESKYFLKVVKNFSVFDSNKIKNPRSDNSFALTNEGVFINIHKFIIDYATNSEITLCQKINTENFPGLNYLKKVIDVDEELSILNTTNIIKNCVYMKVGHQKYISIVPNFHSY